MKMFMYIIFIFVISTLIIIGIMLIIFGKPLISPEEEKAMKEAESEYIRETWFPELAQLVKALESMPHSDGIIEIDSELPKKSSRHKPSNKK